MTEWRLTRFCADPYVVILYFDDTAYMKPDVSQLLTGIGNPVINYLPSVSKGTVRGIRICYERGYLRPEERDDEGRPAPAINVGACGPKDILLWDYYFSRTSFSFLVHLRKYLYAQDGWRLNSRTKKNVFHFKTHGRVLVFTSDPPEWF